MSGIISSREQLTNKMKTNKQMNGKRRKRFPPIQASGDEPVEATLKLRAEPAYLCACVTKQRRQCVYTPLLFFWRDNEAFPVLATV